jgi:hypothetical protein
VRLKMLAYPELVTLVAAELIFLLVRSADIIVLVKSSQQRNKEEQGKVDRGLVRSIAAEALVFVPSSAFLLILLAPLLLPDRLTGVQSTSVYAAVGVASYGFPFATLRRIVTLIALNTLNEFVKRGSSGDGSGPRKK